MAYKNKDEVRAFYELHNLSIKEVAKQFDISYRSLARWVKDESWESGKAIKNLSSQIIQKDIVKKEFGSIIDKTSNNIKQELKKNLSSTAYRVNEIILNNMLERSTEELLLQAMTSNFLQSNQTMAVMLAKNELLAMVENRDPTKPDPMIIACAEKLAKMMSDLHIDIYGKEPTNITSGKDTTNLAELSDIELDKLL